MGAGVNLPKWQGHGQGQGQGQVARAGASDKGRCERSGGGGDHTCSVTGVPTVSVDAAHVQVTDPLSADFCSLHQSRHLSGEKTTLRLGPGGDNFRAGITHGHVLQSQHDTCRGSM